MENGKANIPGKSGNGGLGNTRPERRLQEPMRVLIDWVSVTFYLAADWDDVKTVVGLEKLEMEYHDWSNDTFQEHIRFSHIQIRRKDGNTYQLYLTGQGCREYETLSKYSWLELFGILKDFTNARFTRLDLAIDDFENHYDVPKIRKAFLENRHVTRLEQVEDKRRYRATKEEMLMDSIYFGSQSSRISINIYDKKLEREGDDMEVTEDTWTRTELRIKREYADQAADMILLYEMDLGKVAKGILSKNIRFVKRHKAKNKREVATVKWWDDYLGEVDKLSFSLQAPDRTIEKTKEWMLHSVAPSIAAVAEADPDGFQEFLIELLQNGTERLNDKHGMMIKQYQTLEYEKAKDKIRKMDGNNTSNLHERILKTVSVFKQKKDQSSPDQR